MKDREDFTASIKNLFNLYDITSGDFSKVVDIMGSILLHDDASKLPALTCGAFGHGHSTFHNNKEGCVVVPKMHDLFTLTQTVKIKNSYISEHYLNPMDFEDERGDAIGSKNCPSRYNSNKCKRKRWNNDK